MTLVGKWFISGEISDREGMAVHGEITAEIADEFILVRLNSTKAPAPEMLFRVDQFVNPNTAFFESKAELLDWIMLTYDADKPTELKLVKTPPPAKND